jgi:hypothetical protein
VVFWWVHALYLSADKSYLCSSVSVVSYYPKLHTFGVIMYRILVQLPNRLITECAVSNVMSALRIHVLCVVLGTLRKTMT